MTELSGEVRLASGLPAGKLSFQLFREVFGGPPQFVATVTTDEAGRYALPQADVAPGASLLARVGEGADTQSLVPLTTTTDPTALHFVAPTSVAPVGSEFARENSEFARLDAALTPVLRGAVLADAVENDERSDITLVARESGWDARLVALASMAAALDRGDEGRPGLGLGAEAAYALVRAGLPSDPDLLAMVERGTVEDVLRTAAKDGIVALDPEAIASAGDQFASFSRLNRLLARPSGGLSTVRELIEFSGLPDGDGDADPTGRGLSSLRRFEAALLEAAPSDAEGESRPAAAGFWERVADAGLDTGQVNGLRDVAKLAFLTHNNVPLMKGVRDRIGTKNLARQLASGAPEQAWDLPETWQALVEEAGGTDAVPGLFSLGEPAEDSGVDLAAESLRGYAEELARRVRIAHPTHTMAAQLARGELRLEQRSDVAGALAAAADAGFELGTQSPGAFLAQRPDLLASLDEATADAVTSGLETLHRVQQLTPSDAALKAMLDHGLTSAHDVLAMSLPVFLERYEGIFVSRAVAELVYRRSEQIGAVLYNFHAMTQLTGASPVLGPVQGDPSMRVAAAERIASSVPGATVENLFGNLDFSEVPHSRSVLSPAAYLVDLLKFLDPDKENWESFRSVWRLRHHGEEYTFDTPYAEFVSRRPDIPHIQLTHENTHTELPAIDLVNEILEYLIAHGSLDEKAARDSGVLTSAEVLAEPEFVEAAVYDGELREAAYPPQLPFDLWHETTRKFADAVDAPLREVLSVFPPTSAAGLAMERLGLTLAEYEVIVSDDVHARWWTRFGYDAEPAADTVAELGVVTILARALGISYQDLAELLTTRWINPGLEQLKGLVTAGVSVSDAVVWRENRDMAGKDKPTDPTQERTWTTVQSVQRRLDAVSVRYGLRDGGKADAWLAAVDSSLIDSVVVINDSGPSFDRAYLAHAGGQAVGAGELPHMLARIDVFLRLRRCLGWSTAELDAALAAYAPAGEEPFGDALRETIDALGRQQLLADLLAYDGPRQALTALWAPLDLATYDALLVSGPVRDRDPAFAAPLSPPLSEPPKEPSIGSHLIALQAAFSLTQAEVVRILASEQIAVSDDLTRRVVDLLNRYRVLASALNLPVSEVLTLRRLHPGDPFTGDALVDFVTACLEVARSPLTVGEFDQLVAARLDPLGEFAPEHPSTRAALYSIAVAVVERAADEKALGETTPARLVKAIAAALGRPEGTLRDLFDSMPSLLDGYGTLVVRDGTATPDLEKFQPPAAAAREHARLCRLLLLADRLALSVREIAEFRLFEIPVEEPGTESQVAHAAALRQALRYVAMRDDMVAGSDRLLDVLGEARGEEPRKAPALLALLTRRTTPEIDEVISALGTRADLGTIDGVAAVWRALRLVHRTSLSASTLAGWSAITDPATSAVDRQRIAREAREALRARGRGTSWQRAATPVNDKLRQRRRDALVARALHQTGLSNQEELYERLLIDPGSEPVLKTSRIRQAISAVQTFVNRCLLGLEPRVHPSTIDAEQWGWLRRYRPAEANKKIFLWCENWCEPEFRDDKSHLFEELEATLLQGDITADLVEDAFLAYLRGLDEIARLDVCGMYWEQDLLEPGNNTLHVLGRTHGQTRKYFYRRQQQGIWTPWEPMGIQIEGDHIVPVIWRDRLHVFWVTFLEEPDTAASAVLETTLAMVNPAVFQGAMSGTDASATITAVNSSAMSGKKKSLGESSIEEVQNQARSRGVARIVRVGLNWSEYVGGTWSPPRSSGFGRIAGIRSDRPFDASQVFVHTSTLFEDGAEAGVQVHLTGATTRTLLLRGRNSEAEAGANQPRPSVPFVKTTARVNRYTGSGRLQVRFNQRFTSTGGRPAVADGETTLTVLGKTSGFSVLTTSNAVTIGGDDIGSLVAPFFFMDAQRTFFVEPALTETTTETFEQYIVTPQGAGTSSPKGYAENLTLVPYVPPQLVPPAGGPGEPDPWSDYLKTKPGDVILGNTVGLAFGDRILGPRGHVELAVEATPKGSVDGGVDAGALVPDLVASIEPDALERAGLTVELAEFQVMGSAGLATRTGIGRLAGTLARQGFLRR